jgi:hypothetical protein
MIDDISAHSTSKALYSMKRIVVLRWQSARQKRWQYRTWRCRGIGQCYWVKEGYEVDHIELKDVERHAHRCKTGMNRRTTALSSLQRHLLAKLGQPDAAFP